MSMSGKNKNRNALSERNTGRTIVPKEKMVLNARGFIENKLRLPLVPTRITTFEKIRDVLRQLSIKC